MSHLHASEGLSATMWINGGIIIPFHSMACIQTAGNMENSAAILINCAKFIANRLRYTDHACSSLAEDKNTLNSNKNFVKLFVRLQVLERNLQEQ